MGKPGIKKRRQREEEYLRWKIKNSRKDLTLKERTVAKWIGYITKHDGRGVDLVVADGKSIRELPKRSYKDLRQLEVSHREVTRQIMANEKELFVSADEIIETIYSLIQKGVLDCVPTAQTWRVDDGSDPNRGEFAYSNYNLFLRLNAAYY